MTHPQTSVAARLLGQTAASYRRARPRLKEVQRWSQGGPYAFRGRVVKQIEKGNWAMVRKLAAKELASTQPLLHEMHVSVVQLARQLRAVHALTSVDMASITSPSVKTQHLALIRQAFTERHAAASSSRVDERHLKAVSYRRSVESMASGLEQFLSMIDSLAVAQQQSATGGLLSRAVALFNLTDSNASIEDPTREARRALAQCWKPLADSLHKRDVASALVRTAILGVTALDVLAQSVTFAATLRVNPGSAKSQRAAIEAARMIRSSLLASAAAIRLRSVLVMPTGDNRDAWFNPPQAPVWPSFTRATANIADALSWPDGEVVMVEGMLGPVTIQHRGRKVISSAAVRNSRDKQLTIFVPYIKLDSGGAVEGAPVSVTGAWRKQSPEIGGPGLQIDLESRQEASRQSIEGWATFLLRDVYQPIPHGLALTSAWIKGVDGPANQMRYGTWFEKRGSHAK